MNVCDGTVRALLAVIVLFSSTAAPQPREPFGPVMRFMSYPPPQRIEVTGFISWRGPDRNLAGTTSLDGCISNIDGDCTPDGKFVILKNLSSEVLLEWTSKGTAIPNGSLGPGQRATAGLAPSKERGRDTPPIEVTVAFQEAHR